MKKLLALVLALVMTLSLCVTSNAAYTDAADVDLNEAVDVMTAVGVFQGSDGKFDPKANLTREQAAKLVAYLQIGQKAADALVGGGKFSDVAKDRWSAGYVDYCASIGIAAGVGGGLFDPTGSLTALQFGKMLLVCLGYDAKVEGMVGTDWSINASKLMTSASLLSGLKDVTANSVVTREQAAQMMLNTLKAPMVEYENKGSSIAINGALIELGASKANYVTTTLAKEQTISDDTLTNSNAYTIELGEKLYTKLVLNDDAADDFGRPANEWKLNSKSIGTYASAADNTLVLNKSGMTNSAVLVSDVDYMGYAVDDFTTNAKLYVNGALTRANAAAILAASDMNAGDVIEIFENSKGLITHVIVSHYTALKIKDVSTSLNAAYTKKGATTAITLEHIDDDSSIVTLYDKYTGDSTKVLAGFDAATYTKGTVIAVALKGYTVLDSHVATAVEGKVALYKAGSKANITVADVNYPVSYTAYGTFGTDKFNYDDTTYTVYLDKNGYVVGLLETELVKLDEVYYVVGIVEETSSKYASKSYYAQVVKIDDGTVDEIVLEKDAFDELACAFYAEKSTNSTDTKYYVVNSSASTKYYKQTDGTFNTTGSGDAYEQLATAALAAAKAYSLNKGANRILDVKALYTFSDNDGFRSTDAKSGNGKFWGVPYRTSSDSTYYVVGNGGLQGKSSTAIFTIGDVNGRTDDLVKKDITMTVGGQKVYLDKETVFVKAAKEGSSLTTSCVTGGTSADVDVIDGAIAVAAKSGASYYAKYVVLVDDNALFDNVNDASDIVYVSSVSTSHNVNGWLVTLYYMDGDTTEAVSKTVKSNTAPAVGFYKFTEDDKGIYTLDNSTTLVDVVDPTGSAYDDESGFLMLAKLDTIVDNALSVAANSGTGATTVSSALAGKLADVAFASDVIVLDDRTDTTINGDLYKQKVETVGQLKDAVNTTGNTVYANVYYDDGYVVCIDVRSMTADGTVIGTLPTEYAVTTALTGLTVNSTTGLNFTSPVFNNGTCEAVSDLKLTASFEYFSGSEWVDYAAYTIANGINTSGQLTDMAMPNARPAAGYYWLTIVVGNDAIGYITLYSGNVTVTAS